MESVAVPDSEYQETPLECARCGVVSVGEFPPQPSHAFCCDNCWTCRICGAWLRRVLWPEDWVPPAYEISSQAKEASLFPACHKCYYTAYEMSAQAKAQLLELDDVKSTFYVWDCRKENRAPPMPQPAEVCEGLFVGDFEDIRNVEGLVSRGIGAVLDLSQFGDEWLTQQLGEKGIAYKAIVCSDNRRYDIVSEVFPEAFEFIAAQMKLGRHVIVNCWAGENRSPAVVVGFLVQRRGMTVLDAFRHVTAMRGSIINNRYFRYLLIRAQCAPKRRRLRRKTAKGDIPWL